MDARRIEFASTVMFASRTAWRLSPNPLAAALERHKQAGRPIIDLAQSNPTEVGLTYNRSAILSALSQPAALQYSPQCKGLLRAREAVSDYYSGRGDQAPDPEQIVLTTSTSEGYSFIFRLLCDPGDKVLVPQPSYPLFEYLASLQDVRLTPYHLFYDHGWHIDLHSVKQAINERTRAILVVHPNNPTGSYVSESAWQELSELCARHELALVADEVFLDYNIGHEERNSFVCNSDVLTFTLSGLSKICALPQMKLAWIAASGPRTQAETAIARLEVIADTYLSVSTTVQLAAEALLGTRDEIQKQLRGRVTQNLAALDARCAGQKACTRLEVQGGWYAIVRVPVTGLDEELALALLEKHSVLAHTGHFFDFQQEGHVVLSLITSLDDFRLGVEKILSVF